MIVGVVVTVATYESSSAETLASQIASYLSATEISTLVTAYPTEATALTTYPADASLGTLLSSSYPTSAEIDSALSSYRTTSTAAVVTAANAFLATLDATELAETVYAYDLTNVETWSNLPGATRDGPTLGATSTTSGASGTSFVMTAAQRTAALALIATAVSTGGYDTFNNIRAADSVIESTDSSQPWGAANYHVAMVGTPSTTAPWMLQISGHHLAYNITYNGTNVSATPMFIGTEPPNFSVLADGTTVVAGTVSGSTEYFVNGVETSTAPTGTVASTVAPIETQRAAADNLLTLIQADTTVSSAAKLSESFDDVTMGINSSSSGNNDTNYPFNSATETTQLYPTGTTDRGVLYTSLSSAEQRAVLDAIGAWVITQKADVALDLYLNYVNPTALAETYVAYSPGESGTADFSAFPNLKTTPLLTQGSYLRIDGPRVWIEAIVQEAVAFRNEGWVHYHTLWRDKTADYGACFSTGSQTSSC